MVIYWFYDGYMMVLYAGQMGKRGKQETADGEEPADSGCATSRSTDKCDQNHNQQTGWWLLLSSSQSFTWANELEKDQSSMPPRILNNSSHPARTAWALAAEAVWAAGRRERRRRPRSWRRSARAMNIWTGGAKLELVTIDSWVLSLSVYSYCLQSGRGKYLGLLTLLALVFFQIRWS